MDLRTLFGILPPDLGFSRERLSVETLPVPERVVLFIPKGDDPPATSPAAGKTSGMKELVWTNGEAFSVVEIATSEEDAPAEGAMESALPAGAADRHTFRPWPR